MNRLLGYFFCLFFIPLIANAQEEGELRYRQIDSVNFKVNFFKSTSYTYNFTKGDVVAFSFQEGRAEGLGKIKVISPSDFVDPLLKDAVKVDKELLEIKETGAYTFKFINRKLALELPRNRRCRFAIWKVTNVIPLSNFVAFDTVVVPRNQPLVIPQNDTVLISILDQKLYVEPKLNLITPNRVAFPFTIPKEVYSWAYWIGAGAASDLQYQQWITALADEGKPEPIYAYLHGDIAALPVNKSGPSVSYVFTDYEGRSRFFENGFSSFTQKGQRPTTNIKADFGITPYPQAQETEMYLCLENEDKLSGTMATVKIIAAAIIATEDSIVLDSLVQIQPTSLLEFEEDTPTEVIAETLAAFQASLTDELETLQAETRNKELSPDDVSKFSKLTQVQALINQLHEAYGLINEMVTPSASPIPLQQTATSPVIIDTEKVLYVKNGADSIYAVADTSPLLQKNNPTYKQQKSVDQLKKNLHKELDTLGTTLTEATQRPLLDDDSNSAAIASSDREEITRILEDMQAMLEDPVFTFDELQEEALNEKFREIQKLKDRLHRQWSHLAITKQVIANLSNFEAELKKLRTEIQQE